MRMCDLPLLPPCLLRLLLLEATSNTSTADDHHDTKHDDDGDDEESEKELAGGDLREGGFDCCGKETCKSLLGSFTRFIYLLLLFY